MSRQRKQTLSVREYVEPVETGDVHCGERNHDPFLAVAASGSSSPLGLSLEGHGFDVTPEELDDGQLSTYMESLGDDPWDLGGLEGSPAEIFQYLRYTSTPKRAPTPLISADSGLHLSSPSQSQGSPRKRIRYSAGDETSDLSWSSSTGGKPCSVLLDITGDNSLYRRAAGADSFVNIADADVVTRLDRGSENCRAESDRERGKRVSIIRRNLSAASKKTHVTTAQSGIFEREFAGGPHRYSAAERKKVAYYTGVEDWDAAASLLNRFRLPTQEGLTADRVVLMTLMRLRLHLEWTDLAFRFDTSEETVVRLFKGALEAMAGSLVEELAWSGPRTQGRPRFIYVQPVTFMGELSVQKILVAVTGGKRPVLYVSRSHPSEADSVTVLSREVAARLIPGDVLCTRDGPEEQKSSCWRVERGGLRRLRPSNLAPSLALLSEPLRRLKQFKMFSGRFTATEAVTRHIITVISALVNIDFSSSAASQVGPNARHEDFGQLRL